MSTSELRARRSVLAAATGGVAALIANALGRPSAALAGVDGDVVLGSSAANNQTTTTTKVVDTTASHSALWGEAPNTSGNGVGVRGDTYAPSAENADRPAAGLWGESHDATTGSPAVGVLGRTPAAGQLGAGVMGVSTSVIGIGSNGVRGVAKVGRGVLGESGSGVGVAGTSQSGPAMFGQAVGAQPGVIGVSGSGNLYAGRIGVLGSSDTGGAASVGVFGASQTGTGVSGNTSGGTGVWGTAGDGGTAGRFDASTAVALNTNGRLRLQKVSGVATIAAGLKFVVVSAGVDVTPTSFVLLTAQSNLGGKSLWYTIDAAADTFRINMNGTRTKPTVVAWLLIG